MKHLSIDIETYSSVDITKSGLYKYVQSPDFEVLLFAYSLDYEQVSIVDLAQGEKIPCDVKKALFDPDIIKHAYNAGFEWYCLSKYFGLTDEERDAWLREWQCTMLHGLYCGYTAGLAITGTAMGLPQDKIKMDIGKRLISLFCKPCKPTKTNSGRMRNLPHHEPEKWDIFKEYCKQDVVTESEIERRLSLWPVPNTEQKLWQLDQQMNALGVAVDMVLVEGALEVGKKVSAALTEEAKLLSGVDNPKSVQQLSRWLEKEVGEEVTDLRKDTVQAMLATELPGDKARRVLEIRQELGKTSTKKYDAIEAAVCEDGRVRGLLQFYGANRTGRWAGRLVQVQNLPRNYIESLDTARTLVKARNVNALRLVYGNVPDTLSQLIRTAFIPSQGNRFVVADFSAIEARVLSWLAGELWRQQVFATHGKIYEASAAAMFHVPIETIAKGHENYALRQKGKIAELALGYGGGEGALISMGALSMGLDENELPEIKIKWRQSNPNIVKLWRLIENAALNTVETGQTNMVGEITFRRSIDFKTDQDFMLIDLPSGRSLFYAHPHITLNQWGGDSIEYYGMNQSTKKWGKVETFGGKLTENIIQALARDCLAELLKRSDAAGYKAVMHIHDEVVLDVLHGDESDLDKVCAIMAEPIEWAPDLILRGDGFVGEYYKK